MKDPGRVAAAISILRRYRERPAPLQLLMQDWSRGARFAGSKDRAFVRGLCLDALRRWRSYGGEGSVRIAVLLTLRDNWRWAEGRIREAFSGEHGDGKLSDKEWGAEPLAKLDLPEWLEPQIQNAGKLSLAYSRRAPVDLRANALKTDRERALKALQTLGAAASPLSPHGIRIAPPAAAEKGPGVTVIPAYGKGWVEVQDEGSQLTVLALGDLAGKQVLDLCAGAGGKTLALAAHMGNSGQIFAYDTDPQRLAPIHDRLRRAGVRNVQIVAPSEREKLEAVIGKMDVVFVDAPCSGSGTWRRSPDAKWRLTPDHLRSRQEEQDEVLSEAARYVRPGGMMAYVTCSFLPSENDDRIAAFLERSEGFEVVSPVEEASAVSETLQPFIQGEAMRLSPESSGTDGFTMFRLVRAGAC